MYKLNGRIERTYYYSWIFDISNHNKFKTKSNSIENLKPICIQNLSDLVSIAVVVLWYIIEQ